MISLVLTVCLYLRVKELQNKMKSTSEGSGGMMDEADYDTKLDISDRSSSSIGNPLADDEDGLTTIELNSLKAEYLRDDDM